VIATRAISRRILEEIEASDFEEAVKELARSLLRFEVENWRLTKVRFTDFYLKEIERSFHREG
jgi:hypothetical protein